MTNGNWCVNIPASNPSDRINSKAYAYYFNQEFSKGFNSSCNLLKNTFFFNASFFPISLQYFSRSISWDSLPNKLLALESTFQSQLLGNPKPRCPPLILSSSSCYTPFHFFLSRETNFETPASPPKRGGMSKGAGMRLLCMSVASVCPQV